MIDLSKLKGSGSGKVHPPGMTIRHLIYLLRKWDQGAEVVMEIDGNWYEIKELSTDGKRVYIS